MIPGNSKIFSTSVDFPHPDGPETMNAIGGCDEDMGV